MPSPDGRVKADKILKEFAVNCLIGLAAGLLISGYLALLFVISGSEQSDQSGGRNFAAVISIILAIMFLTFNQRLSLTDQCPWQPYLSVAMFIGAFVWSNLRIKSNPLK
ncbi:MAG: hypothetical protein NTV81_04185 [Candidatus Komeilibacteria bacterium]|nr:hypothetical protein [Candidatus Komeilibacteria bacterium]